MSPIEARIEAYKKRIKRLKRMNFTYRSFAVQKRIKEKIRALKDQIRILSIINTELLTFEKKEVPFMVSSK
ncbi:hypothetical protein CH361_12040 [Leptospira brenneri]|nr:hypothetical protein CH361_12040 [Leptospira brenneri]